MTRCKGRAGSGPGSWLESLRQRQVPAASGRRGGLGARRGRPGVTSASRTRARRRARPEQPGARASPPSAEGAAGTVAAAAQRQHPLERRPRLRSRLLRREESAAARSPSSRSPPPPAPPPVRPRGAANTRAPQPFPAAGSRAGGAGREGARDRGPEAPSSGLHSARSRDARQHREPARRGSPSSGATPLLGGGAILRGEHAGPVDPGRPSAPSARPGPRRRPRAPAGPCPGCAGTAC